MRCIKAGRETIGFKREYALDFKGKTAPVCTVNEHIYYLDNEETKINEQSAEKLFKAERLLCELFSYSDKKIIDRNITKSADDNYFYYDIEYSCEEDIGEKAEILLDEDFYYDGTFLEE